ncbi:MAG: tetratricopeptide repeat protein [Fibrobacter sp.]|nr:tetratricopeptide repeat protein [Fibrobacter sp.]
MNRVWKVLSLLVCLCSLACVDDLVDRGNLALHIGDYSRAISNFSKALDEDPGHRDARYGLALAYYAVAEDREQLKISTYDLWERTVEEFEILSRVDSSESIRGNYSNSLFYLARATLAKNGNADVMSLLDRSIDLDSLNYFSLNLKGLLLESRGHVEDARKIFVYIVTREPKFASAYVNLGNLYWNEGDVESAWDIWSMGHIALPGDRILARWTKVAEDSLKAMVQSGRL